MKKESIQNILNEIAEQQNGEEWNDMFFSTKIVGINEEDKTIKLIEISVDDIFVNDLLLKVKEILDKLEEVTGYCIRQRKLEF